MWGEQNEKNSVKLMWTDRGCETEDKRHDWRISSGSCTLKETSMVWPNHQLAGSACR